MSASAAKPTGPCARPETVLVVDDVAENVAVLGELLQPAYRVLVARSGAHALRIARASAPDLILLDVMMEDMDGHAVLARLRADPATRTIPVIFVTALSEDADEQHGLGLGAADYIAKPIRPAVVLARIRTQIALKRASDQLRERSVALERSVRDLEAFSYTISHDLGAPLRAIRGFAAILAECEGGRMGPQGRKALERIVDNGARMERMMDDILAYSMAEHGEMACSEVDLAALTREVAGELADAHPAIRVSIGALPTVRADPTMLRQILANLLGNGFKYSATRSAPHVEVGARAFGQRTEIFVRDNGVGFDPAAAEGLFEAFQRLPNASGSAGSGLGLAIVRRLVERHGGRVRVESEPGKGATFAFTLSTGERDR